MPELLAAIDQGTTSTRCVIFDADGRPLGSGQREHRQIMPRPGWVEHDPHEIWSATGTVVAEALSAAGCTGSELAGIGITNQRETVVFWDPTTGETFGNAIVWQDTRSKELCDRLAADGGADRFRATTGLPLATYFSGPKIAWALEHVDGLAAAASAGRAVCGTVESWLVWNLTGGSDGGAHVSDVTNACRTQLLGLRSLDWDAEILGVLGVPRELLPRVVASADPAGWGRTRVDGPFGAEVLVCGALGDQQAALVGQGCLAVGAAKNTYGTGCFMLLNTGTDPVASDAGLLTTVAYRFGDAAPVYALEGSIAIAGAVVQWLRDNLGLIERAEEIEALAAGVDDTGGVAFVPAFSGLFAPHWRSDARGVICGLTRYADRRHIARAALEAVCFQTREVLDAMRADSGLALDLLRVDGGMTRNNLLLQLQADLLGCPVERPAYVETTVLGAARAAAIATGLRTPEQLAGVQGAVERRFEPTIGADEREARLAVWRKAVERSLDWVG